MIIVTNEEIFKIEGFDFVLKRFTLSDGQKCVDEESFKFILDMFKYLAVNE